MPIQIAYIKVPVVIDCNNSEIESRINEYFGHGVYGGHEYHAEDLNPNRIILALIEQNELIKKITTLQSKK